jgi:hypothetical protein
MELRQTGCGGDPREPRLAAEVFLDVADGARHAGEIAAVEKVIGSFSVCNLHGCDDSEAHGGRDPILAVKIYGQRCGCGQRATATPTPIETTSSNVTVSPINTRRMAES